MKTIRIKLILGFLCILSAQSCIEDFIEVEIPSRITQGNFPVAEEDFKAILTGLYDANRDQYNTTLFGEDRSDSFDVGIIGTVSDSWAQNLNGGNGLNWRVYYNLINNINLIISGSENAEFNSSASKGQILGEAYFLRAFMYFQMIRVWGDVPLILEPVDQNTPVVGRSPVSEVMAQIFEDLDNSIESFPSDGFNNTKYAASRPATYALLADSKMWNGKVLGGGASDFQDAIAAIDKISGVSLLSDFEDVFNTKLNSEVIFSIFFDFNEQHGMYASRVSPSGVTIDRVLNPDVPSSTSFNARANYRPSDNIINLYTNSSDQRLDKSIIPILVADGPDPGSEPDIESYAQNKFKGTNANNDTFYDNDIIVYRWADMLLLRAEAKAALNQIPEAVADLNLVRQRAGTGLYNGPLDKNTIEREILDERGRELFLELKRYWDLVRFDAGGTINIYNQVPNLQGSNIPLLWPVNDNLIAENDLIEQTPGYD
ncbi:RagB/SusD family nutrient uptake outer membrane protein [uncultured Polaribacter sp.]|uniref:RagB/SusD family nutrient uptake outer membrane protein n=1 Tax=uncultured Polaribacter sp. TaxID=174711 RepID=UPI00261EA44F|nr:RagB/SusD family nutrient uptake outer membrane protein [uncultured Polaribacter sp.]